MAMTKAQRSEAAKKAARTRKRNAKLKAEGVSKKASKRRTASKSSAKGTTVRKTAAKKTTKSKGTRR